MADLAEDLRATSEALEADGLRLASLEQRKQSMDEDDPAVADLSREIEVLVRQMAARSTAERRLAEEIADGAD
ncbi:MAG: hypothetical protein ACLGIJ_02635 [Candidatus Limnocylindria bacterium]